MRYNKDLKRSERIRRIATRFKFVMQVLSASFVRNFGCDETCCRVLARGCRSLEPINEAPPEQVTRVRRFGQFPAVLTHFRQRVAVACCFL